MVGSATFTTDSSIYAIVEAMMVTASTQRLALSRQPATAAVDRIAASSQGRALRLGMCRLPHLSGAARRARLRDRDCTARHFGMHALDHAAVDLHHALPLILWHVERGDHLACLCDFVR